MLYITRLFSNFVERYLLPVTQHRLWQPIYPTLVVLLGLMSAVQQKYIGDAIRLIFVVLLLLTVASYVWLRVDPRSLRCRWVVICQRHHSQFFQSMMLATAVLNSALRRAPHLEVVSYRRGSVLDYVREEQAELTRRFPETVGYLVTFDQESLNVLREKGVRIGGTTYKLCSMRTLGLSQDFRLSGLQIERRASIDHAAEEVAPYAHALFWGLAGVVVKQLASSASVGGYVLKLAGGRNVVDLRDLIGALNSDTPPNCRVYVVNWPVLLWNLAAMTLTGKAELHLANEIEAAQKLLGELKVAATDGKLTFVDNPYVIMEELEASQEAIVIGGGSWLLSNGAIATALLPIWSNNGRPMFSRYMECLGYLLPDGEPSKEIMNDAGTLDDWIARRFQREILMTTPSVKAARVSLPCWVVHEDVLGDLPSIKDVDILPRVMPPRPALLELS